MGVGNGEGHPGAGVTALSVSAGVSEQLRVPRPALWWALLLEYTGAAPRICSCRLRYAGGLVSTYREDDFQSYMSSKQQYNPEQKYFPLQQN